MDDGTDSAIENAGNVSRGSPGEGRWGLRTFPYFLCIFRSAYKSEHVLCAESDGDIGIVLGDPKNLRLYHQNSFLDADA